MTAMHLPFRMLPVGLTACWLALVAGCGGHTPESRKPAEQSGSAKARSVVKPERTTLRRTVRQPGQIQAYEQTPIYPKIPGYVLKWHVDIGDFVKEGQVLAELY